MIKKFYLSILTLTALLCFGAANAWGDETLTLYESSTSSSSHVPVYGSYLDENQHNQFMIPAGDLTEMQGGTIKGLKFYLKSLGSWSSSGSAKPTVVISVAEVDQTNLSALNTTAEFHEVYSGTVDFNTSASPKEWVITFPSNKYYTYGDKNLLIDFVVTAGGKYITTTWHAKPYSGGAYAYNSARSYLPRTTFTYAPAPVSCAKPSDLKKTAGNANSATFTWTKGADETSWQYICLPAESTVDWSDANVQVATSETATVSGLTASSDYKFYVRAYCNATDQSANAVLDFTTPCEAKAVPFNENFNNAASTNYAIPDCWSRIAYVSGTSYYPYVNSSQGVDGSKCLYFSGGASTSSSIIILPILDAPTNTLAISFDYKNSYTNRGQAKIGYMTDPTDASTFQVIKALDRLTTWTSVEEELLTGAPANSYIAIQFAGGSSNSTLLIDNIEVAVPATCKKPGDLKVGATSPTSLKAAWTAKGEETSWNVRYSTDGTNWTTVAAATNPFTLTGLTASTAYEVQVQANCGGEQSDWTASKTATTMCAPTTGIGFSQDFNTEAYGSGVLPSCWSKITNDNSYPKVHNFYAKGCTGRDLYFYGGVTGTSEQIAILPPFSEATNTLYVTLYYSNSTEECDGWYDYSTTSYGQLAIGFITDPTDASTFTAQEVLPRVKAYTKAEVALVNAPVGSYVAICYTGGSVAGEAYVDDISISAIPTCVTPSGLNASPLSSTSAQVSWTSSASAWNLQYSISGANEWTTVNNVTENPYTLTGLTASTDYEIQVQTVCGSEETSNWSSSVYFSTPCDVVSMPFSQNFNSLNTVGQIPSCWDNEEGTTTSPAYKWSYNASGHEGACVRFDSYNNYGDNDNYLKTPEIAVTEAALLSFWYKNPAGGDYSVYYSLDGGATTAGEIITGLTAAAWTKYSAELPAACVGKEVTIVFKGTSNYAYGDAYLSLDDVSVEAVPSCFAPAAPVASDITANSAQLAWTAGGTETAWSLQVSNDGTNWTDVNGVITNPYTLSGLSANTTYYARVKAVCSVSDESEWSDASAPFQTECAAAALPFSEDFSAALSCWTLTNCESSTGVSDGKFMFYYTYNPSQYLITPEIDTENKQVIVEFDYYVSNGSYPETFQVGYSTTTKEVSAFTWGETVTAVNQNNNILKYSDVLPAGVKYVSIQHSSYDKYFLYIDNLIVEELPACPKVKANTLAASNITAHTATIAWSAAKEETAWNLQYKAEGEEWSDVIPVATTPSYTFTGETALAANTVYYVRVQADCAGEGTSEYTDGTFSFETECVAFTVAYGNEWSFGFETEEGAAVNTVPSCWKQLCSTDDVTYAYALVDNEGAKTGSQCLHIEAYHNYSAIAVLPAFSNDLKDLQISFAYKNENTTTNYGQLEVGYYLNGVFTRIGDKLTRVTTYTDMKVDMPDSDLAGAKIAFRIVGAGGYRRTHAYIDDIVVCKKPIVLADNANNADTLAALNGQNLDIVIGRTLVAADYYNTICLPFDVPSLTGTPLEGGDLWAFMYAVEENAELLFRIVEASSIEAGKPYFIAFPDNTENIVNPLFKNVTISATAGQEVGNDVAKLCGIVDQPVVFTPNDQTKLFLAANNTLYWWAGSENSKLNNFRAYFKVSTGSGNAPARYGMPARIIKGEQHATGIDNAKFNDETIKRLENNQVIIIRNGVKYNIQGQVIQ